jgi:hypothetical protein
VVVLSWLLFFSASLAYVNRNKFVVIIYLYIEKRPASSALNPEKMSGQALAKSFHSILFALGLSSSHCDHLATICWTRHGQS